MVTQWTHDLKKKEGTMEVFYKFNVSCMFTGRKEFKVNNKDKVLLWYF